MFGRLFDGLDKLVDSTVQLFSTIFTIKSFTKAWLISGFMIAYVYLAGLLILFLLRLVIRFAVDFVVSMRRRPPAGWFVRLTAKPRRVFRPSA
jgi:hypothetical protein